jgi:hypothetical protein
MATDDLGLAEETEALYYHGACQVRHFIFPEAGPEYIASWGFSSGYSAPIVSAPASLAWAAFNISAQQVEFPWRFSEGCRYVRVGATLATQSEALIGFRATTQTMVEVVATTSGTFMASQARSAPNMLRWRQTSQAARDTMRFIRLWSDIDTPEVPDNRRVVIVPQTALNQDTTDTDVWVYLVDMVVMDLPDREATGA